MGTLNIEVESVGEAYLRLLADRGIDYLFGNAGTDFPSIIEAYSKIASAKLNAPTPVTVPHENVAVAMAYGYYMITGRPQAVMFHVSVGTANGIGGLLNAAREQVPILFTAGRTPLTETEKRGARSVYIHWGQEMFDQAGMVRELVKWDYELRNGEQLESVVDRALNMAMSSPRGPVYLSLPREVLAESPKDFSYESPSRRQPASPPGPDNAALQEVAKMLVAAQKPLIITQSSGRNLAGFNALSEFAEQYAIPVVSHQPRYVCLSTDHPMHAGYGPAPFLKEADLVICMDADVPWVPSNHPTNPDCKFIHIGNDPLFGNYPIRGFPCDLAITGETSNVLPALASLLVDHEGEMQVRIETCRQVMAQYNEKRKSGLLIESLEKETSITKDSLAYYLNQIKDESTIVIGEPAPPLPYLSFTQPGTYFTVSPAGGLGWGLGAALGAKLASPKQDVIAMVGDGSYMFGNPTPTHFVSAAQNLPFLTIIVNNGMWGSVRKATLGLYPDGEAAKDHHAPLTYLQPTPNYEKIVEASGGYGECVKDPKEIPAALERALHVVRQEGRQAVLNMLTSYDDTTALADARK